MSFSILQPPRILFGRGTAAQTLPVARGFGGRGLVVHGSSGVRAKAVLGARIFDDTPGLLPLAVVREPTLTDLTLALALAKDHRPDWVLGIGGGAVLDEA